MTQDKILLIIDDNAQVEGIALPWVIRYGWAIHQELTSNNGYNYFIENRPNIKLALIDIKLARGDRGFDFLKRLMKEGLEIISKEYRIILYSKWRTEFEEELRQSEYNNIESLFIDDYIELFNHIEPLLKTL